MSTSVELSEYSLDELQELSKRLERELKAKRSEQKASSRKEERERRRSVMKQVRELISAHKLKMDELIVSRAKRAARGEGRRATSKSPPKYRNPENQQQTWTGKGRKPGWMSNAMQNGMSLEALLIPVDDKTPPETPAAS